MIKIQFSISGDDAARLRKSAIDMNIESLGLVAKTVLQRALDRPALLERGELDAVQVNKRLIQIEAHNKKLIEQNAALELRLSKLLDVLGKIAPLVVETHSEVIHGSLLPKPALSQIVEKEHNKVATSPTFQFGVRHGDRFRVRIVDAIDDPAVVVKVLNVIAGYRSIGVDLRTAADTDEDLRSSLLQCGLSLEQFDQVRQIVFEEAGGLNDPLFP